MQLIDNAVVVYFLGLPVVCLPVDWPVIVANDCFFVATDQTALAIIVLHNGYCRVSSHSNCTVRFALLSPLSFWIKWGSDARGPGDAPWPLNVSAKLIVEEMPLPVTFWRLSRVISANWKPFSKLFSRKISQIIVHWIIFHLIFAV